MNILSFLSSINKISIVAFLATLFVLSYEVYLIRKERKKTAKLNVPKFQQDVKVSPQEAKVIVTDGKNQVKKQNNVFIILLTALLIIFGLITGLGFLNLKNPKTNPSSLAPTPVVEVAVSKGVKLLSSDFNPLGDSDAGNLKAGDSMIVGVETIEGADIDWARIRVNKLQWSANDTTTNFDPKNKVYYIKHTIATGESQLKIEAELHSKADGWLGD